MASLLFDSMLYDLAKGSIDFDTDTFKVMLVTNAYSPNKGTHAKRSDVTNEVSGTGYTAGGAATTVTVTNDTTNHRTDIAFSNPSWANSTITARAAVIYKSRGGASSADELVGYCDFGADVASNNGTFQVTFNTPLRLTNPN
jgi:hypothetical protein